MVKFSLRLHLTGFFTFEYIRYNYIHPDRIKELAHRWYTQSDSTQTIFNYKFTHSIFKLLLKLPQPNDFLDSLVRSLTFLCAQTQYLLHPWFKCISFVALRIQMFYYEIVSSQCKPFILCFAKCFKYRQFCNKFLLFKVRLINLQFANWILPGQLWLCCVAFTFRIDVIQSKDWNFR